MKYVRIISIVWRPFVSAFKVVTAHNLGKTIRMGRHVGNSLLIIARCLVRDHVT